MLASLILVGEPPPSLQVENTPPPCEVLHHRRCGFMGRRYPFPPPSSLFFFSSFGFSFFVVVFLLPVVY
jgi:hypothetical protein